MITNCFISILTRTSMLFGLAFVSACGAPNGEGNSDLFNTMNDAATIQRAQYIDQFGTPLPNAERANSDILGNQGTATYMGYLTGTADGNAFVATLSNEVNFLSEAVISEATDFTLNNKSTLTGAITGTGTVNPGASDVLPQFTVTMGGILYQDGIARETEIGLDGDFYVTGTSPTGAIAGVAEGNIGDSYVIDGLFSSER